MPLIYILAAPGSPSRFLARTVRRPLAAAAFHPPTSPTAIPSPKCCPLYPPPRPITLRSSFSSLPIRRKPLDDTRGSLDSHVASPADENHTHRPQLSRTARHSLRSSRPASVLDAIGNSSRRLYVQTPPNKKDLSYNGARRWRPGGLPPKQARSPLKQDEKQPMPEPTSLYTILSRHIRAVTSAPEPWDQVNLELRDDESSFLHSRGYSSESVVLWTHSLLEECSLLAARVFESRTETPPLFLLLLFLRRQRIKPAALGITMRHITLRLKEDHIDWTSLGILVIRLLRHARVIRPETMPWIASLYAQEAMRIYTSAKESSHLTPKLLSELTRFSNVLLSLVALPASVRPVLSSLQQEKAQFGILQFMASCDPALSMTKTGFRAVTRNQLAHSKTPQERVWAELKGPSWPPWKEDRNAMDEEKGYEFGASRASRIMHRMYEAGYAGGPWEEAAEIYAGWDTDLSPTIQTRTSFPHISTHSRNRKRFDPLVWAGRIRTTRTRREAWACFLAYEAANTTSAPSAEVYLAMFEKLHYPEIAEPGRHGEQVSTGSPKRLLPGDMKEVLREPTSPLHRAYLSEPIPTFEQFYHRMKAKQVRPANHLVIFLIQTMPDFHTALELLETHEAKLHGGWSSLLDGSILEKKNETMPAHFIGSFISLLCRFGCFSSSLPTRPLSAPLDPAEHRSRLKLDSSYLLEYALAILMQYKPLYRPAWTAYMQKVRFNLLKTSPGDRHGRGVEGIFAQYETIRAMFKEMDRINLTPDDTQLMLLCASTRYTARTAYRGRVSPKDAQHIITIGPRLLRTVFHSLVGADVDINDVHQAHRGKSLPSHIPEPAALHAYVRALGVLRDYEGLYSFSTWAAAHHVSITARANAQHSGYLGLFRTLVALRASLEGLFVQGHHGASPELIELVRMQIESVEEWGWPDDDHVVAYIAGRESIHGKSSY